MESSEDIHKESLLSQGKGEPESETRATQATENEF